MKSPVISNAFVATLLVFQTATSVKAQVTNAWADMLVSQGLLVGFECPSLIDQYANEHPESAIVKSGVENTLGLAFMGMQGMFTVGGIYSVQDLYGDPLYRELANDFQDQFKSEMKASPAIDEGELANRVIEMCRQFIF